MAEFPIIMSDESVRQIQAGTKTQTRRLLTYPKWLRQHAHGATLTGVSWHDPGFGDGEYLKVEYAQEGDLLVQRIQHRASVGDTLWVKQAWAPVDWLADGVELEDPVCIGYRADQRARGFQADDPVGGRLLDTYAWNWSMVRWRSPLFMPKWACQLRLEVKAIRCQRLQDITPAEARAEGIMTPDPVAGYALTWDQLNGQRAPWVFALTFALVRNP